MLFLFSDINISQGSVATQQQQWR